MSLREIFGILATIVGVFLGAVTAAAIHQDLHLIALGAAAGTAVASTLGWRSLSLPPSDAT